MYAEREFTRFRTGVRNLSPPPARRKRHIACDEIFMLRIKISSRAHSAAPRSRTGFASLDLRLIHEKYADRLSFTNLRPSDIFSVKYPGAQLLFCQAIAEQPQAYFFLSTILMKFKYAPPPASMALRSPTAYSFS